MKPVKINEMSVSEDGMVTISFQEKNNSTFDSIQIALLGFIIGFCVASLIYI